MIINIIVVNNSLFKTDKHCDLKSTLCGDGGGGATVISGQTAAAPT